MPEEKTKDICNLYYSYVGVLKKHRKKYLNKKVLWDISTDNGNNAIKELLCSPVYMEQLPIS